MGLLPDVFGDKLEIDGRHYLMCLPAADHGAPADQQEAVAKRRRTFYDQLKESFSSHGYEPPAISH